MIPFIKIKHIKGTSDLDITKYFLSANIAKVTEAKKNSLSLDLFNPNDKLSSQNFERDESTIEFYLDWEPITTQNPVMTATVDAIDYVTTNNGKETVKIKALDKTGIFLSKLWSFSYQESSGFTAKDILINAVNNCQDDLPVDKRMTFVNVATTRANGGAFKTGIAMAKVWKPLYEWLNELSTTDNTGDDRSYVYYLDSDNDLHWNYPYQKQQTILTSALTDIATTINIISTSSYPDSGVILIDDEQISYTAKTSTTFTGCSRGYNSTLAILHANGATVEGQRIQVGKDGAYNIKTSTNGEGDYNMVIFNAGKVPAGYEYLWYVLDPADTGKQIKQKFRDWKSISQALYNVEKTNSNWGVTTGSYPTPGGSALSGGNTYTTSWGVTVASNSAFDEAWIAKLKAEGIIKANGFFATGRSKWTGSVNMKGNTNYDVDSIVTLYQSEQNITKRLRIKDVRHTIDSSGWFTQLGLETDPEVS